MRWRIRAFGRITPDHIQAASAVSGVFLGAVALFVSYATWSSTNHLEEVKLRPLVAVNYVQGGFGQELRNAGFGPAVIQDYFVHDGQNVQQYTLEDRLQERDYRIQPFAKHIVEQVRQIDRNQGNDVPTDGKLTAEQRIIMPGTIVAVGGAERVWGATYTTSDPELMRTVSNFLNGGDALSSYPAFGFCVCSVSGNICQVAVSNRPLAWDVDRCGGDPAAHFARE